MGNAGTGGTMTVPFYVVVNISCRWMPLNGHSRYEHESILFLEHHARGMRNEIVALPVLIADSVFMLHSTTIISSTREDPLAMKTLIEPYHLNVETHLIISKWAGNTLNYETEKVVMLPMFTLWQILSTDVTI